MKTNLKSLLFVGTLLVSVLSSCALFDDVAYTVTPDPLELHGDSVKVKVSATIPEKSINKKAIADVTPVLRWEGGEKALKMITVQGEKAVGNGVVINSKTGGTFTYTDMILFEPGMEKSELFVTAMAGKGTNRSELPEAKIADGVITTPLLVMSDDKVIMSDDKFERITQHNTMATINYMVNSSKVRNNEMNDEDIDKLKGFLAQVNENDRWDLTGVSSDAYASPEGEISKNENLANDRAESSSTAINKVFKKEGLEGLESMFTKSGKGEDWDGFRDLMNESNIEDKNLIIRILETYTDKDKREEEIKNLAATYVEISKDILPKLRRSQMQINYDITGFSDEELVSMSKSTPDDLNVEELLKAGSLHNDMTDKLNTYMAAERMFPDDHRASNNVGCVLFMQNKVTEAAAKFNKADQLQKSPQATNNLGVIARLNGDKEEAEELFRDALSAGPDASYNLGIVNIQTGDYAEAVSNMSGSDTFNSALAQLLSGSKDGASSALTKSSDNDSAMGLYLKAIIAARNDDEAGAKSMLSAAVAKDSSLGAKAMMDAEFIKFRDTLSF
ncbi:MAG: Flp pilus assembly protein TadD [Flavobacteriales bacterium]|jgi:Flp pilus assembly protein TadD